LNSLLEMGVLRAGVPRTIFRRHELFYRLRSGKMGELLEQIKEHSHGNITSPNKITAKGIGGDGCATTMRD
jgi:hypothetical protein